MKMPKNIERAMAEYLHRHYPAEQAAIAERARALYPAMAAKAPDIGGKKNPMSGNLYMMIAYLAYYEASDHRIGGDAIDEIGEILFSGYKHLPKWVNMNQPFFARLLALYFRYTAGKVNRKKENGQWGNTWGIAINPDQRTEGVCIHLVGCPLADYAKSNGYMELLPAMCKTDHITARLLHAKLIRTHTVAQGADSCDDWYVGDQSEAAKQYADLPVL